VYEGKLLWVLRLKIEGTAMRAILHVQLGGLKSVSLEKLCRASIELLMKMEISRCANVRLGPID
jgi:hypothetical protein